MYSHGGLVSLSQSTILSIQLHACSNQMGRRKPKASIKIMESCCFEALASIGKQARLETGFIVCWMCDRYPSLIGEPHKRSI